VDKKRKEIVPAPPVMCKCGVEAQYGLLPSELGIGYWCGHMVDYDEVHSPRCYIDIQTLFYMLTCVNFRIDHKASENASGRSGITCITGRNTRL
jgi:hypothetical protein